METISNAAESTAVISLGEAMQLAEDLFGLEAIKSECKTLVGYDNKNFYLKGSQRINNNELLPVQEFVFKVINGLESQEQGVAEAAVDMTSFLSAKGVNCPTAAPSVNGQYTEWIYLPFHRNDDEPVGLQTRHAVQMYHYLPGTVFCNIERPFSVDIFYDVGRFVGNIGFSLKVS